MRRCWTSNTMLAVLSIGILHVGSFGQASFAAFTLDPHVPPLDNLALGSLSGHKLKIFDKKNLSLVPSLDIVTEVVCFLPFDSLYIATSKDDLLTPPQVVGNLTVWMMSHPKEEVRQKLTVYPIIP